MLLQVLTGISGADHRRDATPWGLPTSTIYGHRPSLSIPRDARAGRACRSGNDTARGFRPPARSYGIVALMAVLAAKLNGPSGSGSQNCK